MRLGVDGREYQNPGSTGIGRYLADFIRWIDANRPDIVPVVFLNQRCRYEPPSDRVETVVLHEKITPVWDQWTLPRALRSKRIDVFLSPYMKMPLFSPCPVVLIINDLIPLYVMSDGPRTAYFRFMMRMAVRSARRIAAISDYTRQDVAKVFDIAAEKIQVVHLGIRKDLRPVSNTEIIQHTKDEYGITKPYILYVGQFRKNKNVGALIEAYALLPDNLREEYQLVVGGAKVDEFPHLSKLAESPKTRGRVIFTGHVDDEYFAPLLSGAAVFVYPSKFEGFGFPPLEAMACGAPVVSSTATSLGEIVGEAALRVENPEPAPLAEAIQKVLEDEFLRTELVRKGAARAAEFTVDHMARGFMKVIESARKSK